MPRREGRPSVASDLAWLLGCAAAAVLAVVLLRTFVVDFYLVPTGSMLETIQEGDLLVGEKVTPRSKDPEAGDIVTFESPLDGSTLIKRVIATGGQTIDLVDGRVVVDGEVLEEPYVGGKPTLSLSDLAGSAGIAYPYEVPEGCVWLMGDNRTNSKDSRFFGPVSLDDVTSKALFIYWPPADVGAL